MDASDIKLFYEAVQAVGKEKVDRQEFEARHVNLEARVGRLETEIESRYTTLLAMVTSIKDSLASRDRDKLNMLFISVLSFLGGGGVIGLLIGLHLLP